LKAKAEELAHRYVLIDGHVDLPTVLSEKKFVPGRDKDTILNTRRGDFDYTRAKAGGLTAPFMSIYVSSRYQKEPDFGKSYADSLIDMVHGIAATMADKFALASTPADVDKNFEAGKISLPMGMENGAPFGKDIKNVKYFFNRGIRYVTLSHSSNNQICDSSGDTTHLWNGLSPFGREVVKEMNRVGIMVDISHVDDSTFYQVMKMTKVPCIASHSSARYFAPNVRRDMTDDMIKKLGENNGVMLINFYTAFLDSTVDDASKKLTKEFQALLTAKKLSASSKEGKALSEQFEKNHALPKIDIAVVANHIDHVVAVAGIDHVGLGSDFDGVDERLPTGLTDVSMYPNLIYLLLKRGYSEEDIQKIMGGNFRRVWQAVLKAAEKSKR
jgi:membrane dipeptidase